MNKGSRDELVLLHRASPSYVSKDRHTTFAEIYPPGTPGFDSNVDIKKVRAAIKENAPPGVTVYLTGRDPLQEDIGGTGGPSSWRSRC